MGDCRPAAFRASLPDDECRDVVASGRSQRSAATALA